ncbi:phospholipase D-like domain-containing protein [Synechococcus lacustris Tous-12m]
MLVKKINLKLLICVTTALIGALNTGCSATASYLANEQQNIDQPEGIEVRFNQLSQAEYKSPINGRNRPGDNLEQFILEAINGAKGEVLVAVQELSLPRIAKALAAKHRAGIRVRVVVENQYRKPWSKLHAAGLPAHQQQRLGQLAALADANNDGRLNAEETLNGDAMALLETAGVPLKDDTADNSKGSGLMHHKFMVIDQKHVIFGSANFSNSDIHGDAGAGHTKGNTNHLIKVNDQALAQIFRGSLKNSGIINLASTRNQDPLKKRWWERLNYKFYLHPTSEATQAMD